MTGKLFVEIIIRKNENNMKEVQSLYDEFFKEYVILESNEKLIVNIPNGSPWFKNGTIMELFRKLGEAVYIAIAYVTFDDELVTDFAGRTLAPFETLVDNKIAKKYIKKKLMVINDTETSLHVRGFAFNHKFSNPIVEVMNIYTLKSEVRFKGGEFTLTKVLDEIEL